MTIHILEMSDICVFNRWFSSYRYSFQKFYRPIRYKFEDHKKIGISL